MEYLTPTPSQLAAVLKGRRKTRKLAQTEVGTKVGLLPKTVSALESAPERCSVGSLFKLLAALDLELVVRTKDETGPRGKREGW